MKVLLKKLREDAIIPSRGSSSSAGYDLFACMDAPVRIAPKAVEKIGTGISAALPDGWFGAIFARSGLASKKGLRPANCVGVCDSDYRGEYIVALYNDSNEEAIVYPGDRIAQLVFLPFAEVEFKLSETLPESVRNQGGFGSTGW